MARDFRQMFLELLDEKEMGEYNLEVEEEEGRVRLTGNLPSWKQVVEAGHLAGGVRGVKSVVNEITAGDYKIPPYRAPAGNLDVIGSVDVVIIGGGVVGTAIARELARYKCDVVLLEKEADVACGASSANNGMVHSGIGQDPNSLCGKLNIKGNAMFEELCRELEVPYERKGLIGVVFKEEELMLLELLKARGDAYGIPIEVINRDEALSMEPSLSTQIKGAFLAPTTAITSPYKLTIAFAENAVKNGVKLYLQAEVTSIEQSEGRVHKVVTSRGSFTTRYVINAAGIYADRIANMAGPPEFTLHPRKGELLILDSEMCKGHTVMGASVIALTYDPNTKGGGISLSEEGNPLWGPTAYEIPDPEDTSVSAEGINRIIEKFSPILSEYDARTALITFFSGVRAATYTEDFHIAPSRHLQGLINVAGIQSPGLVASPAIAEMVLEILKNEGLRLEEKAGYNPRRESVKKFRNLSAAEKNNLIKKNPLYGHIVCRCEQVSEGEIVEALHRPVPVLTVDAVKRRTRAGMGRCQGSFCLPRVLLIMARELGIPPEKLTKSGPGSFLFSRRTKEAPPAENMNLNI